MSLQSVLGDSLALLSLALKAGKGLASVTPLSVLGKTFVLPSVLISAMQPCIAIASTAVIAAR